MKIGLYFGTGLLVFGVFWLLCRKTGVKREGLFHLWFGEISVFFVLWPIGAVLSLLYWGGEYLHVRSKRRREREREATLKVANKYSHMSMEELLTAQKQVMDALPSATRQDQK
jgi:hypothetical protein